MNKSAKVFGLALTFLFIAVPAWCAGGSQGQSRPHAQEKEGVLVGRISLIEGELLRYVPEQKDWVVTVKDSPFGLDDAVYSGENARAEFLLPNSTWVRIASNTQLQMIALKPDATEVDVSIGVARFVDRSSKAVVKVTTPFGYVVAEPGAAFDLYVGDESVEVIGIRGKIDFIHDVDGAKYEVVPGAMSILADNRQATAGEGKVDAEWDDWNVARDTMWSQNLETKGESVRYLPEGIREDAKTLDENGRWERVYYQGEYRQVWRPTTVEADWAPYTDGRWTEWYGDECWVPYESFGYVTHHYGYWFWANNYWYWAPPVVSVGVGTPFWGIGLSWYPGRVGWVYSDVNIGWFPLLPWEPFYCHRWWGPRGFPVHNVNVINININRYRFANRAVIINQSHLYSVNNYRSVTLRNIDRGTFATHFRASPVVQNTMLHHAGNLNQRYSFTNTRPTGMPNQGITNRVTQNQARFSQTSANINGRTIQQQAAGARTATAAGTGGVAAPRTSVGFTSGGGSHGQPRTLNQNPRSVQASPQGTVSGSQDRRGTGGASIQSGGRSHTQAAGSASRTTGRSRGSVQSGSRSDVQSGNNASRTTGRSRGSVQSGSRSDVQSGNNASRATGRSRGSVQSGSRSDVQSGNNASRTTGRSRGSIQPPSGGRQSMGGQSRVQRPSRSDSSGFGRSRSSGSVGSGGFERGSSSGRSQSGGGGHSGGQSMMRGGSGGGAHGGPSGGGHPGGGGHGGNGQHEGR